MTKRARALAAGISLHAALWYPFVKSDDVSAAELGWVVSPKDVAIDNQSVAKECQGASMYSLCVRSPEIVPTDHWRKGEDFIRPDDDLRPSSVGMIIDYRPSLNFLGNVVKHLEDDHSLSDIAGSTAEIYEGESKLWIGNSDFPIGIWREIRPQFRSIGNYPININVSPFKVSQGTFGDIGGAFGSIDSRFSVARLDEGKSKQPEGGEHQATSRIEKPLGEVGKLSGIFDELGVRLVLIPLRLRLALAFSGFLGTFVIGFWGWYCFYDQRRLLGAALIICAFGLYICGGWLFDPHLIGAPL
jgi:hypothetical protein